MYRVIAALCLVALSTGLLALGFLVYDLLTLPDALIENAAGDSGLLRQYLVETAVSYGPWLAIGLVGVIGVWMLRARMTAKAGSRDGESQP